MLVFPQDWSDTFERSAILRPKIHYLICIWLLLTWSNNAAQLAHFRYTNGHLTNYNLYSIVYILVSIVVTNPADLKYYID